MRLEFAPKCRSDWHSIIRPKPASVFREKMKDMSPDQREKRYQNVGDPERRARYISTYENGVESPYVRDGIAKFEKLFKNMETTLADGRKWLLGDGYTLADISITPFIARLYYNNITS